MSINLSDFPKKDLWQTVAEYGKVIIFGTGDGADKIIDKLNSDGTKITCVCCSGDFVRHKQFRGYNVISVNEAVNLYPDGIFLLSFGSKLDSVITDIKSIAKKVTLLEPTVPVYGKEIFDTAYLQARFGEISKAFDMLADNHSKKVFINAINFYLTGDIKYIFDSDSEKDEVFEDIFTLGKDEKYADIGAYRGDTVQEFIKYTNGSYSEITAIEPDKKSFKKLNEYIQALNGAIALNKGIWNKEISANLMDNRGKGTRKMSIDENGDFDSTDNGKIGNNTVKNLTYGTLTDFVSVDSLFAKKGITYIKVDAEGAEKQVIDGAKSVLKTYKPKLNIAAYHRTEDFYRLILQINKINPNYKFYMRKHKHLPFWDFNIYAV